MSLVTRCPACTTTFKVVRDQLRISDGWVRCGRCSHVFDATLDLHESPDGSAPAHAPAPSMAGYSPALLQASAEERADPPPATVAPPPQPGPQPSHAPEDADFFDDEPEARTRFDALSYSAQQRLTLPIENARTPQTRQRRVEAALRALRDPAD